VPAPDVLKSLAIFHPAVRDWFCASFSAPTAAQTLGWPPIARSESTLILAPTGSGKTLAAFLWCVDRLMFEAVPAPGERCRVLYVSPLKALAVDVERNLRAPIAGVASMAAFRSEPYHLPVAAVRSGDTPARERARFKREPTDILITTPESLYLLLTASAREALRFVDTVIVDEIHSLLPTKRGVHLMLSIERLAALTGAPLQRIGLSATCRPLDEVATFLGGAARPVTIVDAGEKKPLALSIEVPVEDMARLGEANAPSNLGGARAPRRATIWSAIHPRLLELIQAHQSTLIFVNNRRTAERLAAAINELAGEALALAHHGSIARLQRLTIEERLKAGTVRALVATSSLELGIDMGAIDLVIQIEAPPSVASGLQRVGRSGHRIDAVSAGIIFPKYRGDLVACAAVTRQMRAGQVESTRYPRNPLDVLAQQIVAMTALDRWDVDTLYATVRAAAPFAELSRGAFEETLDMLAGRYPSDEFAELRPRVTWDRIGHSVVAREGARRVAVVNGGTIPDRGLYGVFLAGASAGTARVGELDEEMVFESRVGETFVLGATSWRIQEITHDRVLVSPAPGVPGKTPFWRGDAAGRPLELGREIGRMVRELRTMPAADARARLVARHDLDPRAAQNLLQYLADQAAAGTVPDDRTVVIERGRDELGDWRLCVLSPFGGKVLAPWAMAATAKARRETGVDVETLWTDDGFVARFPDTEAPPDPRLLVPDPGEVEGLVLAELGSTALFAAKFREAAARALLLPRRRPGGRAPLWQQRKRAADLLAVAARFPAFPMLLEAYRECLRDVFDVDALVSILREIAGGAVRLVTLDPVTPSPFAASLLFGYVASYIYDGDAALAERRAQALAIDQRQLRELLGDVELRELLDAGVVEALERQLQHRGERQRPASADAVHDLLLRLGDLSLDELARRTLPAPAPSGDLAPTGGPAATGTDVARVIDTLVAERRAIPLTVAGETRYVAVEDAGRYRDGLGAALPPGLPAALLTPVGDPRGDLVHRYARTHGPFTTDDLARRYGWPRAIAESAARELAADGKLLDGEFRPGGHHREWCDPGVLEALRRRSLARLRHEVEPVEPAVLGRFITSWQGIGRRRSGLDALLDVIESLQGAALVASAFEREILAARVEGYTPADLDALAAAGEVVWCGLEPLGERDGRIALYLTDHLPRLWRPPGGAAGAMDRVETRIVEHLGTHGALFFGALHEALGGGFAGDTLDALWRLVWKGVVGNDTFQALRALVSRIDADARHDRRRRRAAARARTYRSRRLVPPAGGGRWSLMAARVAKPVSPTEWSAAVAQQLLRRHGIVTRETVAAECIPGGFSAVYDVLKAMEEAGRIRRGYFASGVGAAQFALPAALAELRALREEPALPEVVALAAIDPANPYGGILRWPRDDGAGRAPTRTVGATVVLVNGACAAYVARGGRALTVYLPEDEPARATVARAVADALARRGGVLVAEINGAPAPDHPLARFLVEAGFTHSALGFTAPAGRAPLE
jgi:ATP-dependent Lhr-like helicase